MVDSVYSFSPEAHRARLEPLLAELDAVSRLDARSLQALLRRYPKEGGGFFSKSELLRAYRQLTPAGSVEAEHEFVAKLRMKPIRTQSGVAPVTVLTKPYPCPGRCVFCPSDVRMPKSYLSDEPGAQRAAEHQFDPYGQTFSRLQSFHNTGHSVDKVELIVLGGTWSSYPLSYQLWFLSRCLDALNDFEPTPLGQPVPPTGEHVDFRELDEEVNGAALETRYNDVVRDFVALHRFAERQAERERANWKRLGAAQRRNETALARCVGLVLETRPDRVNAREVVRLRRQGATKIQLGIQSLDDEVLSRNDRGHDVARSRDAVTLLRRAGFKLHLHWMPNLLGSSPERDVVDFARLFSDPAFRPDELKIYPCSLIESAELMRFYESGEWSPYSHDELLGVVKSCLTQTPEYCRLTRVIRDIPGTDIVTGNKLTNFRQLAERAAHAEGLEGRDIRARELRSQTISRAQLHLDEQEYSTTVGVDVFLQYVTDDRRLAGFLRLYLPGSAEPPEGLEELRGQAIIREVHVYGAVVPLGRHDEGLAQHLGLGRSLIGRALALAAERGFERVAVISSIGTREYYRRLGFVDGPLYQHIATDVSWSGADPNAAATARRKHEMQRCT